MNLPFFTSSSFTGTAKELVDKGVKVNGRMIDQVTPEYLSSAWSGARSRCSRKRSTHPWPCC